MKNCYKCKTNKKSIRIFKLFRTVLYRFCDKTDHIEGKIIEIHFVNRKKKSMTWYYNLNIIMCT